MFGLALHATQDYFAHITKIYYGKTEKDVKNLIKKEAERTSITSFNNYVVTNLRTSEFEDKKGIFPWRYDNTQTVTNTLYKRYVGGKRIKKISPEYYEKKTTYNLIS